MKKFLFSLCLMLFTVALSAQTCKQVIGYCANWQWYDRAHLMNPMSIPYEKYSILNYSFFRPQASGHVTSTDDWADENLLLGQINWQTVPVSYVPGTNIPDNAHAVGTKVVISIGGWNDSNNFPAIAASASKRAIFAHDCVMWCDSFNLDGIDIDWEYPGYVAQNGTAADKGNFTLLMQQIRDSLNVFEVTSGKQMLLTAAVGAAQSHMDNVNWAAVAPILDYINLMSYDFYGTWDAVANHNSPLHQPSQGAANFSIEGAVNLLTGTYGVPAAKINVGVAFYGRSLKTVGIPTLFGVITGSVDAATFAEDEGMPLYYNLLPKMNLFNANYDAVAGVPYLTGKNGLNTFVTYDNQQSIAAKAQYIVNNNLAGAIVWEISGDMIGNTSNVLVSTPLVDTLNAVFCGAVPPPTCANVSGLTASATLSSLTFSWTTPVGVDSVSIRYRKASTSAWTTVKRPANLAFTVSGLPFCTAYLWEVRSECGTVQGDFVAGTNVSTLCCTVPTSLAVLAAPTGGQLTWSNTGATGYSIRWKPATSSTWVIVNNIVGTSYQLAGLVNCTNYQFQARSKCGTTFSGWSGSKTFKTTACTACDQVTQTSATTNGTTANLIWANTGATSYQVRYKITGAAAWVNVNNIPTSSKTITGLAACANYTWQVRGNCGTLVGTYSTIATFATSSCCVAASNPRSTPSVNSAVLKWSGSKTANYELAWRKAESVSWTSVLVNSDTTYTLQNLVGCTGYQFRVRTVCTPASNWTSDSYFATVGCANCEAPSVVYFNPANYTAVGEIKLGQGRLNPIWGVSVDAYYPQNHVDWAIANVHAAHLFRVMSGTSRIPANFYFATAAKESFCGCDANISAMPIGTAYPFTFQAAALGDGCFQIENNSAYNELKNLYPQRFPAGQHANLIGNHHYTTAAISKAYYDIFAMKYWDVVKGYQPTAFFNQATDSFAVIKLLAIAYNRGLWYTQLQNVLQTDRTNALAAATISPYFTDNSYGNDYQNALTKYCQVLNNQVNLIPVAAQANNTFDGFYNPQVSWNTVDDYIDSIATLYPQVDITMLKSKVQAVFNAQNNGATISFRYQMGAVIDALMLNLPADDPTTNLAIAYGCSDGITDPPNSTCATPTGLSSGNITNTSSTLSWTAAANATGYHLRWKASTATNWTSVSNLNISSFNLTGLAACTNYVWAVQAICPEGLTAFSGDVVLQTTGCSGGNPPAALNTYCSNYSVNSTTEWVQSFSIGNYTKNSGNNGGFGNFIDLTTTTLVGGTSVTCSVTAGYNGTPQAGFAKVWIDWNRDGDFNDAEEACFSAAIGSTTPVSQPVLVPTNAVFGYTKMRVALRRTTEPLICDVYAYGEVEDYTVLLQPVAAISPTQNSNLIGLFPNPGSTSFTLQYSPPKVGAYIISILDSQGKLLRREHISQTDIGMQTLRFDGLSSWPEGIYIVLLSGENLPTQTMKWQKTGQ